VTFLTWNIQSGGGRRVHAILRELEVLNPEFIALTEVTATNQLTLEQALVARNYPYVEAIRPPINKNSVLVASKVPFQVSKDVIAIGKDGYRSKSQIRT
jgi:exodeoxyribonuclease III